MPDQNRPTICLAMIARDEAPTIERCLLAAKPYIDKWLIYDTGSHDGTADIARCVMQGVPGRVEERTLEDYSETRNELLESAASMSNLILMLDADEELQSLQDSLALPDDCDAGLLPIEHNEHTIRTPRLFRGSALPAFRFRAGEQAMMGDKPFCTIDDFKIKHHCDGIRYREVNDPISNRFLIESVIEGTRDDPVLSLTLAKLELRKNHQPAAQRHLSNVIDNHADSPEFWQSCYLAANLRLTQGAIAESAELLQRCFESAPERAEPLMRLAELHHRQGEFQIARDLCSLIIDLPIPAKAEYFEPSVYQYQAALLMAESAAKIDDWDTVEELKNSLSEQVKLPQTAKNRIEALAKPTSSPEPLVSPGVTDVVEDSSPTLTIGMATHDDFDGVYFSIVSLVLYHGELFDQLEILVVDNNPDSKHGEAVEGLCRRVPNTRYVAAGEYQGTAVRELIFAEARGTHVLCMDCHVFLHQGAVAKLLNYFTDNPDNKDLLHGPLFYDNLDSYSTHMTPEWNTGFFGRWGSNPQGKDPSADPFEIPLQGMGLFACTKAHWPGFNHKFRGFGGEEGYIHEKFRQRGGRILCLPFLRWTHRFERPNSPNYPNIWADRIRNYLIGWSELGMDTSQVLEHFTDHLDYSLASSVNASFLNEKQSPLWQFDTIYLISAPEDQDLTERILRALSLDKITQQIEELSDMQRLLQMANTRGLANVVLINSRSVPIGSLSENISEALDRYKNSGADIVTSGSPDTNSSTAQVSIIQRTAFDTVRCCLAEHNRISVDLIRETDSSISMNEA